MFSCLMLSKKNYKIVTKKAQRTAFIGAKLYVPIRVCLWFVSKYNITAILAIKKKILPDK